MRKRLDAVTIEQARTLQSFMPAPWCISQTPDGFVARRGEAVLFLANEPQPRVFRSVEGAIKSLREKVGVTEFTVEVL